MTILMWDKPEKVLSVEDWKVISADSAPPGVYTPNMSPEDARRWKAKLVGKRTGHPQVEIRKSVRVAQILVIVNLGAGYKHGYHTYEVDPKRSWGPTTVGVQVHISLNGPAQLTFEEWGEMQLAVAEARAVLEKIA